jgi:hypothetical protein
MYTIKRTNQLTLGNPKPGDLGLFFDSVENVTKCFPLDQILPSTDVQNFQWVANANDGNGYVIGEFVTYAGEWFESLVNSNLSVPGADETKWQVGSKVYGVLKVWRAGLYTETEEFVIARNAEDHLFLWRLTNVAGRPFSSSNFLNEVADGLWEAASKSYIDSVAVYNLTSPTTITVGNLAAGSHIAGLPVTRILELMLTGSEVIRVDRTDITVDNDTITVDSQ